jgi:hypothetical protein
MALPPLYKYLNVDGAKQTLGTRTFRHAKPSTFEDSEDMTIKSVFPEELGAALAKLSAGAVDVILENVDEPPTCDPKFRPTITELQNILKEQPEMADAIREDMKNILDVEHMRTISDALVADLNEDLQRYRVLCVSTNRASERMWEDHAHDHEGIVLRIEPSVDRASKLELFRPVTYHPSRPPLYDQTLDALRGSWFGDQEARARSMSHKIIYAKTLPYKFESEYRLAIPSDEDGDWSAWPYHPEEITELNLGMAMKKVDKDDIIAKAKSVNPNIKLFQTTRAPDRKLSFKQI